MPGNEMLTYLISLPNNDRMLVENARLEFGGGALAFHDGNGALIVALAPGAWRRVNPTEYIDGACYDLGESDRRARGETPGAPMWPLPQRKPETKASPSTNGDDNEVPQQAHHLARPY